MIELVPKKPADEEGKEPAQKAQEADILEEYVLVPVKKGPPPLPASVLPEISKEYVELQRALDSLEMSIRANEHFGGLFTPNDTIYWNNREWELNMKNHALWIRMLKIERKIIPEDAKKLAEAISKYMEYASDTFSLIAANKNFYKKYAEVVKQLRAKPGLGSYLLGAVAKGKNLGFHKPDETLSAAIKVFEHWYPTIILAKNPQSFRDNYYRLLNLRTEFDLIVSAFEGALVADDIRTKAAEIIGQTPEMAQSLGFEKKPEEALKVPGIPEKADNEEFTETYTGT
ncbi:hypothetical protein JXA05_00120 [Candidatus Peregrinibacteria bacterium]|nr:hypothetical protein [Candidatus Peregrinibacteria bacterium]